MEVTKSKSFFSISVTGPERTTPALESIRSRPPKRSTVCATILATDSSSDTFTATAKALSPISAATCPARGSFRSAMTIEAPSL